MSTSLWVIEDALRGLMEARESLLQDLETIQNGNLLQDDRTEEDIREQIGAVDTALTEYIQALPSKIDSIHGWLAFSKSMLAAAKFEAARFAMAAKRIETNMDRLKAYVLGVMRKAEIKRYNGTAGRYLLRKGNGGIAPLTVDGWDGKDLRADAPLPREYRDVVVRLPADDFDGPAISWRDCKVLAVVPNQERIREALGQSCFLCGGTGSMTEEPERCGACGGDGKARVPGARLEERGEHLECR